MLLSERLDIEKGPTDETASPHVKELLDSGITTPVSLDDDDEEEEQPISDVERSRTKNSSTQFTRIPHFLQWLLQKSNAGKDVDTSPPPDGGTAWVIVACSHLAGFNTFGFVSAYGVLQTVYVSMLDLPPSTVSWIGSIQAFLLLFMSAISGRLTDAGYFHQTLFIGTVLQLLGVFAASFATTYWQLLLSHGVCMGLGGGLIFCPAMSLVGTYFSKRRPQALAICAIGNSVGGLVYAAILQRVIASSGFPWAMRTCGFLMATTLLPANFLLKPRAIRREEAPMLEWRAWSEPVYGLFTLGMFFSFLGQWVPVFYLGSFGRTILHLTPSSSATLILIINGTGILGRLLPALLSSHLGPLNLMVPLSLLASTVLFSWTAVHTQPSLIIFDVCYGLAMAAAQGMLPPAMGSLTSDVGKMGTRMGMVFGVCGVAILVGQPIAGLLVQSEGGYLAAQVYGGGAMLVGALFLGAARVRRAGWGLRVWV